MFSGLIFVNWSLNNPLGKELPKRPFLFRNWFQIPRTTKHWNGNFEKYERKETSKISSTSLPPVELPQEEGRSQDDSFKEPQKEENKWRTDRQLSQLYRQYLLRPCLLDGYSM
jgi:hypothetical protein